MTIPTPSFRCELRQHNGTATVVVEGELEEISAVQLAAACFQANDLAADIVLDLGGVSFVDGSGVKMVETVHRACQRKGHTMTIVNPSACVRRELDRLRDS
jgi:anti-sigma B factor antagonist